ncbi:MAG: DEAD/DEAH box helicase, partial [Acutalibacteraceae bacterium]
EGLTTPKQIRLLERYGFKHVGQWDFDSASKMISRISALGWKRIPDGIDPATYNPNNIGA